MPPAMKGESVLILRQTRRVVSLGNMEIQRKVCNIVSATFMHYTILYWGQIFECYQPRALSKH